MHSIYCADMQFKNISLEGLVLNNFRGIESWFTAGHCPQREEIYSKHWAQCRYPLSYLVCQYRNSL